MLNTHPELYWASLEPEACPPFLRAPTCLPAFHSQSPPLRLCLLPHRGQQKDQECHYAHLRPLMGAQHMSGAGLLKAPYLFMF